LIGVGQWQVFRLRPAFATVGPSGSASKKRGRPSNHRRGAIVRADVLTLVREHLCERMELVPKTVAIVNRLAIAMIDGEAMGGGMDIALPHAKLEEEAHGIPR